jgi:hypothetical protein
MYINKSRVAQNSSDSVAWNSRDKSQLRLERPEKAGTKGRPTAARILTTAGVDNMSKTYATARLQLRN